jgi:hypothetical protein
VVFANRKVIQPIPPDIGGDKSVFEYSQKKSGRFRREFKDWTINNYGFKRTIADYHRQPKGNSLDDYQ